MDAQRIVFPSPGQVALETCTLPAPTARQVQLQALFSVISPGTELAFLHAVGNTPAYYPLYPGYSTCAKVMAVGREVQDFQAGQTVAVMMKHASAAVVDVESCWPVPDGLAEKEAAFFRLVSIALQGVRKAQVQLGQSVAVLGLGMIGNLTGQLARQAGATSVVGIDPVEWRRQLARECGFDAVLDPTDPACARRGDELTESRGFDVVIEASGVPEVVNQAFVLTARLGRTVLLGSSRGLTNAVNFYRDVHKKGLTVIGAHESARAVGEDIGSLCTHRTDGRTALQLMAARRITVAPLLSLELAADQAVSAYARLSDKREPLLTVVLNWQPDR